MTSPESFIASIVGICIIAAVLPALCAGFLRAIAESRLDRERRRINRYRR
jgi:hypothetical protein